MADAPTITVAPDAAPFACGVAATIKRSATDPALAKRLLAMKGTLALRSAADKQAATVRFESGVVTVSNGASPDAGMTITLDPNDASVKPKVKGALTHLPFALHVAKVMEPPAKAWWDEAAAFWEFAADSPRMPDQLVVVCTDDGGTATYGTDGGTRYEIHGSADALRSMFGGSSIYGEDILSGKLLCIGSFEHASILTGRSIAWVMGQGR